MSAPVERARTLVVALLLAPFGVLSAQQNTDLDGLSRALITLRADVEQLNSELDLVREETRSQLAAQSAQKAELEAQLKRQDLSVAELRADLEKARTRASEAGVTDETLRPVLLQALDALQLQVGQSLPFKQDERIAAINEIRTQIETGTLGAHRGANRIWGFIEDELRLTRENGLYAQTIELEGARVLADLAKIGNVMLFFRTEDGRVGAAERDGQGWRWRRISDPAAEAQIATLFDALRKQIRQGWFELPNALLAGGAK